MSNQEKQMKNTTRHEGATAPPRPKKKEEEILSWEDLIGYPTGIYNSYKEMIYAEFGDHSEQAVDLDKSFRNAVELNKPKKMKKEEEKNTCYKCDVEVTQDNFYRDEFNNKSYNCCNDCGIEEEDSDDEDSVAHPVYKCDGGCGTIMGSDDDCKRICDDCEEDSDDEEEDEDAWCEVGEHHVSKDDMWNDFADCKNCVSEKEYKEQMKE
jgi:hypothetical protein